MNLPNGKYIGVATAASIKETTGGAIMVHIHFNITSPGFEMESITAHQCLRLKDQTINKNTYEAFRACFGWGGGNPYDLKRSIESGERDQAVELVIEQESFTGRDGTQKVAPKVQWINPIGGNMPESDDEATIMAKIGPSLRAMGGTTDTVNSAKTTTVPTKAPSAPSAPPAAPSAGCTKDAAWHTACTAKHGMSDAELNTDWFDTLGRMFPGRTEQSLQPQDWAKVKEHYADDVPY